MRPEIFFFVIFIVCLVWVVCLFISFLLSFVYLVLIHSFFAYQFVLFLFFIICFSVGLLLLLFFMFSFFSFHPLFSVVIIFYSAIKLKTRGVAADLRRILQPFAKDEIFLFYGQVYEKLVFEILPR